MYGTTKIAYIKPWI